MNHAGYELYKAAINAEKNPVFSPKYTFIKVPEYLHIY